jgi:hypothetical protein
VAGIVRVAGRFRSPGQRVCLTCCEVGSGVTHSAESKINFRIWKADTIIRHTVTRTTQSPFEKSLRQVPFSPLTTRGGSQRRAKRLRVFFTPPFTRDLLFQFPGFAVHSRKAVVYATVRRFSLFLTIRVCHFFHACLRIRIPSRRAGRRGRHEGPPLPLPQPRSPQRRIPNHEVLRLKRTALVR